MIPLKWSKLTYYDIFNLQFDENAFDIVTCNNVILHLPPPPIKAISELIRVSKKYIVLRTVFGERNYITKHIYNPDEVEGSSLPEGDLIKPDGSIDSYSFFNMYTEQYFRNVIYGIDPGVDIQIHIDNEWQFFDNEELGFKTGTKVVDDKQVSGNLILDWRFIILTKE